MATEGIRARPRPDKDEPHVSRRKRILRYRAATALAGGLLAMLLITTPAAAQETSGGAGGGSSGGAGGTSSAGAPGGAGANGDAQNGGGGGGAGTDGGTGGNGEDSFGAPIVGGAGGIGPGGDGGPGTSNFDSAASGGGGGAHGYVGTILPTNPATGGRGGDGGDTADFGPGGGGGAGGYGAVISGGGDLGLLTVAITGGAGGAGGTGGLTTNYGAGGQGGHGLVLLSPSILTIGANISGGNGGQAFNVPSGLGGYGIVGGDLNITIGAAVSGGLGGDGVTRSYGLFLTGGDNVLALSGGTLVGGIRVAGGSLTPDGTNNLTGGISLNGTLRLFSSGAAGGASNTITTTGSVIVYGNGVDIANPILLDSNTTQLDVPFDDEIATQSGAIGEIGGPRPIEKIGPGTLILTGANTYTGGTTIADGRLQIGNGGTTGNLGGGDIVNDGTLVFNRSDDITVSNDMLGSGNLLQLGPGTLTLTGFNEYTGVTTVLGGTLAFGSAGLFGTSLIEIGDGAGLRALDPFNGILGDISILPGGGTIDTGAGFIDHFGSINFGGELTKAGSGTLLLEDGNDASEGAGGINVLAGTLALATDNAAGTGNIRLADGTTLANASCFCGALMLDNNIEVAVGGTATLDGQSLNMVLNGQLTGGNINFVASSGQSSEGGGSIFYLNGLNSYGDTVIGPNVAIVLLDGTLGLGNTSFDPTPSDPFTPSALVFANMSDYNYGGTITGAGIISIETFDPETAITLSGSNTTGNNFTGTIDVSSGRLNIDGNFGDIDNLGATLTLNGCACSDATLGGSGTFYGNVDIVSGTLAAGSSPGTLTIAGNLTLGAGTMLNFEFGQPGVVGANVNDFVTVGGNLTLDGTLNIIDFGPSYGPGYYRLFSYGGTLTDNGLAIGSIDGGLATSLLFNIPGQVNLLLGPQVIQYWDGADTTGVASGSGAANGNGGAGTWSAGNTNWTAGSGFGVNDQWRSTVGVFAGAAGGIVTVDGAQSFQELRFQTNGYSLLASGGGGALVTTGGFSVVDVSGGISATIGLEVTGGAGLTKTGAGTLTLSTANSYTGLTTVSAGTLQILTGASIISSVQNDATFTNFGYVAGTLTNTGTAGNGGTIAGDVFNSGSAAILTTTGTINGNLTNSGTVTAQGQINGAVANDGTFNVTGALIGITLFDNQAGGQLNLQNNNLAIGGLTGSGAIDLGSGLLTVGSSNASTTFSGAISGAGGLTKVGTGTLTLSGTNVYGGTTTVNGGVLILTGSLAGPVANNATYIQTGTLNGALTNNGTATLSGQLNGDVDNQSGSITLTGSLTGIAAFNQLASATFDLAGFNTAIGSLGGAGSVQLGTATLTAGGDNSSTTFAGVISGSGGLTKIGTGTLTLSGANSYAGLTTTSNGTLEIASGGSLIGPVLNNATFNNSGDVDGLLTNNGNATNTGRLDGGVDNRGTFDTRNIINGNLINSGTVLARGALNGSIVNDGSITLTGFLFGVTNFTQGAGGSLDLGGTTLTVAALNGLGTIRNGSLIAGTGGAGGQFDGAILDGGLTKVEGGTLILGGANTANLNVSGGTLILSGSTTGAVTNSANFQNAGVVGGLVQNQAGATALNGGTMNGGVINDGTFRSTGIVSGNVINRGDAFFQGQLNSNVEGRAGIITLTGTTTGIGRVTMSSGALFDLNGFNASFGSLSGDGQIALGAAQLTVGGDNTDTSFAGIVTGADAGNGLTKIGTGTLTLSGANTYTGTTNVTAGTLTVAPNGRISGDVVNSATFNNDGRVELVISSGTGTNSGVIAQGVDSSGTFTNTGTIGVGIQNLAGGTFNARGQINGFVANLGTFNVTGALSGIGIFLQAGTGQTNLNDNNLTVGALQGDGGVNLGTATLTTGDASNVAFFGGITGSGNLTKVGTGTLVLGGANTFTGLTTVSAGTLGVLADGSLAGPVLNNATLLNDGTIGGLVTNNGTFASAGTLNGGLTNNGTAQLRGQLNGPVQNQSGSITLTGTLTGLSAFNQAAGATFNLANFNATVGSLAGAGSVQLGTATLTLGGNNGSTTFAGTISGNGQLVKVGTGTLTLSGANTYTGTTDVSAGTLSIAAGGSLVSAIVDNPSTLLNAGLISGFVNNRAGGSFTNSGTVASGVLNAGTVTSTGIINVGLRNEGTAQLRGQLNGFVDNAAGTITLTGALTGITTFTQAASATLNLNGFSLSIGTLSGAGSITFGGAAAAASAGGSAPAATGAAPGWLVAQDSAQPETTGVASSARTTGTSATTGAAVSRSWLIPQDSAGPGEAALASRADLVTGGAVSGGTGDPVAVAAVSGATETPQPAAMLTGGGTTETLVAAPAVIAVQPAESVLLPAALPPATGPVLTVGSGNVDSLFSGVISGNGRLVKVGTGTLILTGNNTYTDGTLISGGVLQLGDGGTSGSILGRIENNATLVVNRSDALTLSGIIDGTGLFVQAGTGTTTLTGVNAYTGGTLIQAGRLRGDVLSIQGNVQNNATLELAQASAGTFNGRLFGAGAVEKTGAGLLTFNTDNSNLTGETRILGGELRVTNLLSRSRVVVGNGTILSGTSVVGGIVAQSGGTVAPGAGGFGTLGVNGNIQFLAGSTFVAQVQPAGSDLILGNGTAQLAGTIAIANAGGVYQFNSVYVLLQADGGRTGTFGTETGLGTFGQAYAPRIVYTPTQVQLLLAPAQLLNIAGPDGTPNQRSTLTRIDAAVAAGYNPQPLIALYSLTPRAAFLNGADQLSGEVYATSVRVALDDERLVREATFGRLRLTQDMGVGEGFGAWGHAVASWGSGDTDGNAGRYERDQQGFVVGIDGGGLLDGGSWRVGLLGHRLTTDISVDARGSNSEIERAGAGIYGGLELGGLRIRAGGTWSSLDLAGTRVATFTGFAETLSGETEGEAIQGFAEISYRMQAGVSTWVEPYLQAAFAQVEFDAFSETGGASRVRVAAEDDELTTLAFGLRGSTLIPLGADTNLRLDGSLGGRHLSGDRMIFSLISLDVSPNQAFDIRSAAMDRFAVTGTLDATFELSRAVSLTVGYSGVIGSDSRDHAARATLGLRF